LTPRTSENTYRRLDIGKVFKTLYKLCHDMEQPPCIFNGYLVNDILFFHVVSPFYLEILHIHIYYLSIKMKTVQYSRFKFQDMAPGIKRRLKPAATRPLDPLAKNCKSALAGQALTPFLEDV
jgi:hypothetical protein